MVKGRHTQKRAKWALLLTPKAKNGKELNEGMANGPPTSRASSAAAAAQSSGRKISPIDRPFAYSQQQIASFAVVICADWHCPLPSRERCIVGGCTDGQPIQMDGGILVAAGRLYSEEDPPPTIGKKTIVDFAAGCLLLRLLWFLRENHLPCGVLTFPFLSHSCFASSHPPILFDSIFFRSKSKPFQNGTFWSAFLKNVHFQLLFPNFPPFFHFWFPRNSAF
jgi:hypothetical protein